MPPPIYGLTLTPAWAFAVARLGKPCENRMWRPQKHGGCTGMWIAVHAGSTRTPERLTEIRDDIRVITRRISEPTGHGTYRRNALWFAGLSPEQQAWLTARQALTEQDFMGSGIVALARVSRVTWGGDGPWEVPGQYQWHLAEVTPIEPVAYRGNKNLWEIEPYTKDLLRARFAACRDGEVRF